MKLQLISPNGAVLTVKFNNDEAIADLLDEFLDDLRISREPRPFPEELAAFVVSPMTFEAPAVEGLVRLRNVTDLIVNPSHTWLTVVEA